VRSRQDNSRRLRVVVIGDHHAANRGDQAIVKGLLRAAREAYAQPETTILSNNPAAATYFTGCPAVESTFFGWDLRQRIKRRLVLAWPNRSLRPLAALPLGKQTLAGLELLSQADVVLMKGGSFLTSAYGLAVLIWFDLLEIAMSLGKPVAVCGQSIGPLDESALKRAARRILPRVNRLIIREQDSLRFVQNELGRFDNTLHLPDTAFFMAPNQDFDPAEALRQEGINPASRPIVTMSVRDLGTFLGPSSVSLSQGDYEATMAHAADHLVDRYGCHVIFAGTCTEIFNYPNDDRVIAMRVVNRMRNRSGEYTAEELSAIYGLAELNVGTRLHSNILAMLCGTPCCAIAYEHKTSGVFRDLGLADWWIGIDRLTVNDICGLLDRAWSQRQDLRSRVHNGLADVLGRYGELVGVLRGLAPGAQDPEA